MADDKSKRGGSDRSKINIHEDYEVRYWKTKFGVSEQQLKDAVHKVGSSAEKSPRRLGNKHARKAELISDD